MTSRHGKHSRPHSRPTQTHRRSHVTPWNQCDVCGQWHPEHPLVHLIDTHAPRRANCYGSWNTQPLIGGDI